jgi:uncharacterized protein
LFFSVTGITLNHPDWLFGSAKRSIQSEGRMSVQWLHRETSAAQSTDPSDLSGQVAKLEVVEYLRRMHGVGGALAEFKADERECIVAFRGPGYDADAFIDRPSGRYTLTQSYHGFIAVINDLHKGRDTGKAWSLLIDLAAALMTLISLTGLVLLFYLKRRRIPGMVVALVGTIVIIAVILIWVP